MTELTIPTSYDLLDEVLGGGIDRGNLVTVVSRSEAVRNGLTLSLAYRVAAVRRERVLFFSTEYSASQLKEQLATIHAAEQLGTEANAFPAPITFIDRYSDIEAIEELANNRSKTELFGMVVVTGALNLTGPIADEDEWDFVIGDVSRRLKLLARGLNIPVITTLYPGRAPTYRPLTMNDLGPADSFAADSDLLLFPHQLDLETRPDSVLMDLYIAKHRNGPRGVVPLLMNRRTFYFSELRQTPTSL